MTKPLLLYLDAAEARQTVGFSAGNEWLGAWHSSGDKQDAHALHSLIQAATNSLQISLHEVDAVVVNNGPGSYTGLRMGLATAKGLCYALDKPLILLNHLQLIAQQLFRRFPSAEIAMPLVDARRMDAFAAAYDRQGGEILAAGAYTLDAQLFIHIAGGKLVALGGSGAQKIKPLLSEPNFLFDDAFLPAEAMMPIATEYFEQKQFADISLSTPFYFKAFYTPLKK